MIKEDAVILLVAGVGIVGAAWYIKNKLSAAVPQVVKDGAEAAGVLFWEGSKIAADPLDGFGIRPGTLPNGQKKWQPTVPWENRDAPVSNNDAGINFNYF